MSFPRNCANCGSTEGAALVHEWNCHRCGRLTRADGTLVPTDEQYGPDWKEPDDGQVSDTD
jgi:hypothetical protein